VISANSRVREVAPRQLGRVAAFAVIVGLGLGLRLLLACYTYGNADMNSYYTVRAILDRGGNVYAETRYYNYSPVWMLVLKASDGISDLTTFSYGTVIRSLLAGADLFLAFALARMSGKGKRWNWETFALYWLNPGVIAVVGFGGQFETLALLPLVFGVLALQQRKSLVWVFALGCAAIFVKQSTLFLVWALFVYAVGARRAFLWILAIGALFFASFVPFLPAGAEGIWRNVITYTSLFNGYGLTMAFSRGAVLLLMFATLLALPLLRRRPALSETLRLSSFGFLTLVTGFSAQYAMPALAFSSISRGAAITGWVLGAMIAIVSLSPIRVDHLLWYLFIWGLSASVFSWGLFRLLHRRNRRLVSVPSRTQQAA
jgi:hypothetical protein